MSQTPRINFEIIRSQMRMYDSSEQSVEYTLMSDERKAKERENRYLLELELTALDFIRDELKELARDVESRSKQVSQLLDSRV